MIDWLYTFPVEWYVFWGGLSWWGRQKNKQNLQKSSATLMQMLFLCVCVYVCVCVFFGGGGVCSRKTLGRYSTVVCYRVVLTNECALTCRFLCLSPPLPLFSSTPHLPHPLPLFAHFPQANHTPPRTWTRPRTPPPRTPIWQRRKPVKKTHSKIFAGLSREFLGILFMRFFFSPMNDRPKNTYMGFATHPVPGQCPKFAYVYLISFSLTNRSLHPLCVNYPQ